eukprot:gene2031-2500_t
MSGVEFSNQPVVIDNGSGLIKAGFAGEDPPSFIFQSLTTGIVLDAGDGVTHCVPVFEGFALPHAITRMDIAGRDITEHLQFLLRRSGYNFKTSAELEVVRTIKEKLCYVAIDPQKEEELLEPEGSSSKPVQTPFTLPDGNIIELGAERFRAPEILFHPDIIGDESMGIHQLFDTSIRKSDIDLRRTFYTNIIFGGGSTLFQGFGDRFMNEVKKLAPKDVKIKINAPHERKYSAWMGGSILASLSTFKDLWVTHQEYDEEGASILHRKIL